MTREQSTTPTSSSQTMPPTGSGIIKEWGYSGKAMRGWMITLIMLTVALVVLAAYNPIKSLPVTVAWGIPLGLAAVAWLHYACYYLYRTRCIWYRLSDFTLDNDYGFLTTTTDTMKLITIRDIRERRTFCDRFVNGVGTVIVYNNEKDISHPVALKMKGLEDSRGVFDAIKLAHQRLLDKNTMVQVSQ